MNDTGNVPSWLFVTIFVVFVNGFITGTHFLLIFFGLIPIKGNLASVIEIATGDIVVSVIPSFFAVYGLWKKRLWGWLLSFLVAGSYLHGQLVLLARFYMNSQLGSMSIISVYFIVFNLAMVYLLWKSRQEFRA